MSRKIALLGSADTRDGAPFSDDSWEIWDLAWEAMHSVRCTRAFEVHDWENVLNNGTRDYAKWLQTQEAVPVYTVHDHQGRIKAQKRIPIKAIADMMGEPYFASSFSYSLGQAIVEGVAEIGVWGINLHADEEYIHQRPNAEYLLGIAKGRGIKLTIADGSSLLKANHQYGAEKSPGQAVGLDKDALQNRFASHARELDDLCAQANTCGGMKKAIETALYAIAHEKPESVEAVAALLEDWRKTFVRDHNDMLDRVNILKGRKNEIELLMSYVDHFNRGGVIPKLAA